MINGSDRLKPELIFGVAPRPAVIGAEGEVVESTASTMDIARERGAGGVTDGYVIAAEHQLAGRGRTGGWHAPPGKNLLLSVILKAPFRMSERMLIGIMGAVSSAEALQAAGIDARIKWPNDVVVVREAGQRLKLNKLGGVLVEQINRGDSAPVHVLGIGLNINQEASELPVEARIPPATARAELGRPLDRNRVCLSLLRRLDFWYKKLALGQPEALLARWKNISCLIGRNLTVRYKNMTIHGKVLGLSVLGELIMDDGTGKKLYLSDRDSRIILK